MTRSDPCGWEAREEARQLWDWAVIGAVPPQRAWLGPRGRTCGGGLGSQSTNTCVLPLGMGVVGYIGHVTVGSDLRERELPFLDSLHDCVLGPLG